MALAPPPGSALFAHMRSLNKAGWHRGAGERAGGHGVEERRTRGARWRPPPRAGGAQLSGSAGADPRDPRCGRLTCQSWEKPNKAEFQSSSRGGSPASLAAPRPPPEAFITPHSTPSFGAWEARPPAHPLETQTFVTGVVLVINICFPSGAGEEGSPDLLWPP